MILHVNRLQADNSHEKSSLIFFRKLGKIPQICNLPEDDSHEKSSLIFIENEERYHKFVICCKYCSLTVGPNRLSMCKRAPLKL